MSMQLQIRQCQTQYLTYLFVFCLSLLSLPLNELLAQNNEPEPTKAESAEKNSIDLPADSKQTNSDPEKKKDERPRELGVMLIIVWLLLGTGVAILVFTSLFGHSIRETIRRPYPQQSHPEVTSPEPEAELPNESESVKEEPPEPENNSGR